MKQEEFKPLWTFITYLGQQQALKCKNDAEQKMSIGKKKYTYG